MKIPENFIRLVQDNSKLNVSLGYDDIYLFKVDNIEKEQVGYSIDRDGNSLILNEEGSWKANWLIIGFNENSGDSYFIDTSSNDYPLYISMHGEGAWNPTMIADSYMNFIDILTELQRLSRGRENPVALELNPIPSKDIEKFISGIESKNMKSEVWYWENLFD
ncbi:hypothetical protein [Clostridium intestinale]|uniref:hypothetical protein n=1 Tax=Clostridium intestinale TaxID=36845 RepID=UPI0028E442FA|nr:hypothetical protein [Clostridium intestinale]